MYLGQSFLLFKIFHGLMDFRFLWEKTRTADDKKEEMVMIKMEPAGFFPSDS
jgi:hypothetical protein